MVMTKYIFVLKYMSLILGELVLALNTSFSSSQFWWGPDDSLSIECMMFIALFCSPEGHLILTRCALNEHGSHMALKSKTLKHMDCDWEFYNNIEADGQGIGQPWNFSVNWCDIFFHCSNSVLCPCPLMC